MVQKESLVYTLGNSGPSILPGCISPELGLGVEIEAGGDNFSSRREPTYPETHTSELCIHGQTQKNTEL